MIILGRRLSRAILVLEAKEEVQAPRLPTFVQDAEQVALPGPPVPPSPSLAQDEALQRLDEYVHDVEGLPDGQEEALLQHFAHLVAKPFVVWERPLVGRQRQEDSRVAHLSHHVQQGVVHGAPIKRAEGFPFHHNPHGDLQLQISLRAQAAPEVQIVGKLQQFEVGPVPQKAAHRQGGKEALDAVAGAVLVDLVRGFLVLVGALRAVVGPCTCIREGPPAVEHHFFQRRLALLPENAPRVAAALVCEGHLDVPEKAGPQCALETSALEELQSTPAGQKVGARVLLEELLVLGEEVCVGSLVRGAEIPVSSAGLLPHLRILHLLDLLGDRERLPAKAHHGRVLPITRSAFGADHRPDINLQRRQGLGCFLGEATKRRGHVFQSEGRLRASASASKTGSRSVRGLWTPPQRRFRELARGQSTAGGAHAPGVLQAPTLEIRGQAPAFGRRQAGRVLHVFASGYPRGRLLHAAPCTGTIS